MSTTQRWVLLGVVLLLSLLTAGFLIAWNLRGSRPAKQFDPQDLTRTADWLVDEGLSLAQLMGRDKAVSARESQLNKNLKELSGRPVSWIIEVHKAEQIEVNDKKQVRIYPRPVSHPCPPDELYEAIRKGERSGVFPAQCFPAVEIQLGEPRGLRTRDYFQTDDPSWLTRLQPGSRLRIDGVISNIIFERRRTLPVVVCEIHIGLKEVRLRTP